MGPFSKIHCRYRLSSVKTEDFEVKITHKKATKTQETEL